MSVRVNATNGQLPAKRQDTCSRFNSLNRTSLKEGLQHYFGLQTIIWSRMDQSHSITLENDSQQEVQRCNAKVGITIDADYETALQQMRVIVNSADNAFKRDYVWVIWKNLTVSVCLLMRADCRSRLLVAELCWTRHLGDSFSFRFSNLPGYALPENCHNELCCITSLCRQRGAKWCSFSVTQVLAAPLFWKRSLVKRRDMPRWKERFRMADLALMKSRKCIAIKLFIIKVAS